MATGLGSHIFPTAAAANSEAATASLADLFETPSLQHLNGSEPVAGIAVVPVLHLTGTTAVNTTKDLMVYAPAALNQTQLEGLDTGNLHTIRSAQELADAMNSRNFEDALKSGIKNWTAKETKLVTHHVSFILAAPANQQRQDPSMLSR